MTKYDTLKKIIKESIIEEYHEVANNLMFFEAVEYIQAFGIGNFLIHLESFAKKTIEDERALKEIDYIIAKL